MSKSYIKGHPNCSPEDCLECHVVSCLIYLGYEQAEVIEYDDGCESSSEKQE